MANLVQKCILSFKKKMYKWTLGTQLSWSWELTRFLTVFVLKSCLTKLLWIPLCLLDVKSAKGSKACFEQAPSPYVRSMAVDSSDCGLGLTVLHACPCLGSFWEAGLVLLGALAPLFWAWGLKCEVVSGWWYDLRCQPFTACCWHSEILSLSESVS